MADRRLVRNQSGTLVGVDVGIDMDEATFDAMVKRGELTPEEDKKPAPQKRSQAKSTK